MTRFLDLAAGIGDRLCRQALWAEDRCTWLGDVLEPVDGRWAPVHRSAGPDLYNGTSGIALFLGRLARVTGERLHAATAAAALRHALGRAEDVPAPARIALYSGWTGVAHAAATVGDDAARAAGRALLLRLAGDDADLGAEHDVIAGWAGAIPGLLAAHRDDPDERILALAVRCGERLMEAARREERGWSWGSSHAPSDPGLTGLAHGAGGNGWALLELHAATGEPRFRTAAEEAFRYERSWFDPARGNWPDLRSDVAPQGGGPSFMVAWCHGAAGIGLTRLRAQELLDDPAYGQEAEAAVRTTAAALAQLQAAGVHDMSLCHGLAGDAELLLHAGRREEAAAVAARAAEGHGDGSAAWPCGVPQGGGETPGLMLGLAGIGHFFLRLHDPAVPSVVRIG